MSVSAVPEPDYILACAVQEVRNHAQGSHGGLVRDMLEAASGPFEDLPMINVAQ